MIRRPHHYLSVACSIAFCGSLLGAAGLNAAPQSASPASTAAVTTPTDKELANATCAVGEEKFLPGDYYYCLGAQSYGKGYYGQAQKFFTIAASWASKPAQYVLGVMAQNGDQQPANLPLALAWFTLAAERHRPDFEAAHHAAMQHASAAERRAADALLQSMRPTYADASAAVRAEERYRSGVAALSRAGANAGVSCISGARPIGSDPAGSNSTVACVQIPQLVQTIDQASSRVFDGWQGHVTVGELQPLDAKGDPKPSR